MDHLHDLPLIGAMGMGLLLAFLAGLVAVRLRLPALVGYLVAGVAIGPFTPGFVADPHIAAQLAEIGVSLLMFGVGLHFSVRDLWAVRRIAVPGAVVQIGVATALGTLLASRWGWSLTAGLIFGLCLAVASTVVIVRAFQDRGYLSGQAGRIAVGWLIVEDLVMVLALVVLPVLADGSAEGPSVAGQVGLVLAKIGLFFALLYGIGVRALPWLFGELVRSGSRELLTLFVAVAAVSVAYGAALGFGVSFALGAFLAGLVVNEAGVGTRIQHQGEALEHVFAVLFFVSVGMLFNPAVVTQHPLEVLAVLGVIVVGKSLAALGIVAAMGYPPRTALTVSASLAQIGEFSFILAGLGVSTGILDALARDLILAGALLSIAVNPLIFHGALAVAGWSERRGGGASPELPARPLVIVVGYGDVGRPVSESLTAAGVAVTVVDFRREVVEALEQAGTRAVYGEGAMDSVLRAAGIEGAAALVLAGSSIRDMDRVHEAVRRLNRAVSVVRRGGAEPVAVDDHTRVFKGELELAAAMVAHLLAASPPPVTGTRAS
jgi:CPA2 family monovalent cation:H+ antiporter-2